MLSFHPVFQDVLPVFYESAGSASNLPLLRVQKEQRDGHKLPYRTIAEATGLSTGALTRIMNNEFDRVEVGTLEALCRYFNCGVGDLLEYIPEKEKEDNAGNS